MNPGTESDEIEEQLNGALAALLLSKSDDVVDRCYRPLYLAFDLLQTKVLALLESKAACSVVAMHFNSDDK